MIRKQFTWFRLVSFLAIGISLVACSSSGSLIKSSTKIQNPPADRSNLNKNSLPGNGGYSVPVKPTSIPDPKAGIWISSALPDGVSQSLKLPSGFELVTDPN